MKQNRLYHFTKYTSLLKILENDCLKLGNIINTNDPKEYLAPDIMYEYYTDTDNQLSELSDIFRDTAIELRKYQIICFCKEGKSFGFMRPKMWAEYGQHHEGCCLIFDKEKLLYDLISKFGDNSINGNISYTAEMGVKLTYRNTQSIPKFVRENIKYFLFTKSFDWKMEDEYRCIIYNEPEVFIPIKDALIGIVFGQKFSPLLKEAVVSHFSNDLEYYDLDWRNGLCVSNRCKYSNYEEYYLRKCINRFEYGIAMLTNKLHVKLIGSFNTKLDMLENDGIIKLYEKEKITQYYNKLQNDVFSINELRILYNSINNFFDCLE